MSTDDESAGSIALLTAQAIVDRFVLVYPTDDIWDSEKGVPMKPKGMSLAIGRHPFRDWIGNPHKRVVFQEQIVFDPTCTCSSDCINLFRGFSTKPATGDCTDLLGVLDHLCGALEDGGDNSREVVEWVLNWAAYPLQNPGAKMATALVFHGPQGTGKNLFWEAYARIFGEYSAVIGQSQLESRYNDWASRKLFIIGDEIVASNELTHHKNALKGYITGDSLQVETKFQSTRIERNHTNFVFLSNENKPLALEQDDRRHLVVYCPPKRADQTYETAHRSLQNGAVGALYDFLLKRDLSGFHAHTRPPITRAKAELIELGLKPSQRFMRQWLAQEIELPLWPCSTGQLYRAFNRWCRVNGERSTTNQANFSSTVTRYARHRLERKTASPSPADHGVPIVLWVPAGTGPMEGVRWFDFATEAVAAFELPLSRFGNFTSEVNP